MNNCIKIELKKHKIETNKKYLFIFLCNKIATVNQMTTDERLTHKHTSRLNKKWIHDF